MLIDGRTGLGQISEAECWTLLAGSAVGRIGLIVDGGPEIYPINFAVDGRTLVFRTAAGTKVDALDRTPTVCFQVDGTDAERESGWSVLVKGRAARAVDGRRLDAFGLRPWARAPKEHWVRIEPTAVTGRRLLPVPRPPT